MLHSPVEAITFTSAEEVASMQEFVGHCAKCRKQIFCRDGFLDGIVLEDKSLVCFDCADEERDSHTKESKI